MQIVPMTKTTVAVHDEIFTSEEEQALSGFLAGYSGLTREAYALDLRQFVQWCTERQIALFGAVAPTSKGSPATSKPCGRAEQRSRGGCARSPASTATPNRKA